MPAMTARRLIVLLCLLAIPIGLALGLRHAPPAETAAAPRPAPANLLPSLATARDWTLEQFQAGRRTRATLSTDGHTVQVDALKTDGTWWHVQFYPRPFDLKEGQTYRLVFRARADPPADMPVQVMVNQADYHSVGLTDHASLTRQWQTLGFTFRAHRVAPGNNRLVFMVGQKPGRFWVADPVLTPIY